MSDISINANGYHNINIDAEKSGYTAIGIVGCLATGGNSDRVAIQPYINNGYVKGLICNTSSSALSGLTVFFHILYEKNK